VANFFQSKNCWCLSTSEFIQNIFNLIFQKLNSMKTFRKFFFLTALVAVFSVSFTNQAQAQTSGNEDPAMVFNTDNMDAYRVAQIPSRVPNGETVLATSKRDRTQIIAQVREGKIVQVGYKPAGKAFIPLPQNAGPCSPSGLCFSWQIQHCYFTPWGDCICVCGAWISAG
jgi:hypothetical protein